MARCLDVSICVKVNALGAGAVTNFLIWVQHTLSSYPLVAPLAFIGLHAVMAALFLPCSPMTLMAGALWGGVYGLFISSLAALASTATTFILARSFLRDKIKGFLMHRYPKTDALLERASEHDWKLIAVAQMNPLIPASTMGYVFGLSRIAFVRYLLFSGIFMLPLQVLFVMTGNSVTAFFTADGQRGTAIMLVLLAGALYFGGKQIYRKLCRYMGVVDES